MGRGKKTNRNYITRNEWINDFQGKSDSISNAIRGLPFHFCHLSLKPFDIPVCTVKDNKAYIFDMEYVKKKNKQNKHKKSIFME